MPFLEISLQLLSCNKDSFLVEYRSEEGCKSKPAILIILGTFSTFLSILIGIAVLFFLRCFAFNEPNPLKRNYSNTQLASLLLIYLIVFLCFLASTNQLSYFCGIAGGILLILNLLFNPPFKNPTLSKIYTFSVCFFTVSSIIIYLWTYTSIMIGYEVLNVILFISSLLYFGICSWQSIQ